MAGRWSDEDIAATLNRMALPTGQGLTWNAIRVGAYRRTAGIHGYESANKDGRCLTMVEAAAKAGIVVSRDPEVDPVRNLARAPGRLRCSWQILASIWTARKSSRPYADADIAQAARVAIRAMIEHSRFPALEEGAHNETNLACRLRFSSLMLLWIGSAPVLEEALQPHALVAGVSDRIADRRIVMQRGPHVGAPREEPRQDRLGVFLSDPLLLLSGRRRERMLDLEEPSDVTERDSRVLGIGA